MSKKLLLIGCIVVATALLFFSSSDKSTVTKEKKSSNILHRGNGAEPSTLDPHFATGTWENTIIGDMFMGLVSQDSHAKVIPGLAKKWTVSNNGKRYTFILRDAVWSDGKKITAEDFEYSFQRIINPKTAAKYAFILYPIKNAERINCLLYTSPSPRDS